MEENDHGLNLVVYHYHLQGWISYELPVHYIARADLFGVSRIASMNIDYALVTAPIKR